MLTPTYKYKKYNKANLVATLYNKAVTPINQSDHEVTTEEVLASRPIAYPHTSKMACAVGGAACAIVATNRLLKNWLMGASWSKS